jgi:hypothetical protein
MATNEVYKYSDWIPLPIDPSTLQVLPGDPVKVNGLVGVAQAVAGVPNTYTIGTMTVTETDPISSSLEDGYMSVALVGAFAFAVTGADANTEMGTPVYFVVGDADTSSTLSTAVVAGTGFGHIVNRTSDDRFVVRLAGEAF